MRTGRRAAGIDERLLTALDAAAAEGRRSRNQFLTDAVERVLRETTVPVLVTQAAAGRAGAPLFQAAGWVEPRPTPIYATALTEGVIERLLVVEGQEVRAGEPVAHLIAADAELALQTAEADLQIHEAELAQGRAALAAAQTRFRQPVHLEAALAEAAVLVWALTCALTLPSPGRLCQT